MSVGNGLANVVGDGVGGQEGAFLMTTWAETALSTGKRDEHFVSAVGAADASEAEVQIATAEQTTRDLADDGSPGTVMLGVALAIGLLELGKVALNSTIKGRCAWSARAIESRLGDAADHGKAASPCGARWRQWLRPPCRDGFGSV